MNTISNFPISLPLLEQQREILGALAKQTEQFDLAINSIEREIRLLHELSTRVIADVVTGKLDVREAASRLPEEVVESEPMDEIDDLSQDDLAADDMEAEAVEET